MNLDETSDQQLIRQTMREFAQTRVAPIAQKMDEEDWWPSELVPEMGAMGLMGMVVPQELGGAGLDTWSYNIAIEEIAKVSGSLALSLAAHNGLGYGHILNQGNDAQLQKYIPKLASGEHIGAWALTEPGAGSDAAGLQTTAVREGDGWTINGQKQFITNGHIADVFTIMTKTDASKGAKGITAFIGEKGMKGLNLGNKEDKMGMRGSITSQLYFEDLWVPDEQRLGDEGMGFIGTMKTLDAGRIAIGSLALGLGQGAYEASLAYAQERKQFGKPIAANQAVAFALADMDVELEAARTLLQKAAWLKDQGRDFTLEASRAKLFASEVGMRTTTKAIQLHGGNGYTKDYPVERMFRDVKLCEIGEGSSEVQRMVISRRILS